MKKILIVYADAKLSSTLSRIKKEAKSLHIFDKVITYSEKACTKEILSFIQAHNQRGAGYWIWKPYLILKTLQKYPDAVVVYTDAGCSLNANMQEWSRWFELMQDNDLLVTHYRREGEYGWEQVFGTKSVAIETWTRKMAMDYFDGLFRHRQWHQKEKLWAGFMMCKMGAKPLLQEWLNLMLLHPEFLVDMPEEKEQYPSFITHRHDQSLLTAFVYYYQEKKNLHIALLPETAESDKTAAVVASRIRTYKAPHLKTRVIQWIKKTLGEKFYNRVHFWH
ncbi:MAG: hypothetical protein SOZ83_03175 [Sphaerochaetaceae bacterium]|nr:hypothetical protein [Sphaerochaetaceae bacterium]